MFPVMLGRLVRAAVGVSVAILVFLAFAMVLFAPCISLYRVQVPTRKKLPPLIVERGRDTLLMIRPHDDGGSVLVESNARLDMRYLRGAENLSGYQEGQPYEVADKDDSSTLWRVSILPEKASALLLINRDSTDARVTLERYSTGSPQDEHYFRVAGVVLIAGLLAAAMLRSRSRR